MKRFKRILRAIGLVILIILACAGVGVMSGGISFTQREPYMHRVITIEQVDKKEEDEEDSEEVKG